MIVVRVARGITEHFPARASEWGCAGLLIWLGSMFSRWPDIFDGSLSYGGLARLADEAVWGAVCVVIGVLRLAALVINGTFASSWYGRWSPHVRGACAFASCGVWFPLLWGFSSADRPLLIFGFVGFVFLIDFYNIRRVWADAGRSEKASADAAKP